MTGNAGENPLSDIGQAILEAIEGVKGTVQGLFMLRKIGFYPSRNRLWLSFRAVQELSAAITNALLQKLGRGFEYISGLPMRWTYLPNLMQPGNFARHAGGEGHFVRPCRCFP